MRHRLITGYRLSPLTRLPMNEMYVESQDECINPDQLGSESSRLWIWHVGARQGYMPIVFPEIFDKCIGALLLDGGNIGVVERLELANERTARPLIRQLRTCVAARCGSRDFHHRACDFVSGLVELDSTFADWFVYGNGPCDYVLGDAHRLKAVERMDATTLDSIALGESQCKQIPSILIIDAQGAAHEILQGAVEVVLPQVDAIVVETELIPFFGGKPSFVSVLPMLWERGFGFAGFLPEDESWANPVHLPIGQRCQTLAGSKDAVFVRLPQALPVGASVERTIRYTTTCCMFDHVDFGLTVASRLAESALNTSTLHPELTNFVRELYRAEREMPPIWPPKFGEAEVNCEVETNFSESKVLANQMALLRSTLQTPLENCLEKFGFMQLAALVRRTRLAQMKDLLRSGDR